MRDSKNKSSLLTISTGWTITRLSAEDSRITEEIKEERYAPSRDVNHP